MDRNEVNLGEGSSEPGQISHLALDIGGGLFQSNSSLFFSSFDIGGYRIRTTNPGSSNIEPRTKRSCWFGALFSFFWFLRNPSAPCCLGAVSGSLIKLVYFSKSNDSSCDRKENRYLNDSVKLSTYKRNHHIVQGSLCFAMFETSKIDECLKFIKSEILCIDGSQHRHPADGKSFIKATGGGAHKYSDLFKEKLGVVLDKEDEMDCLVAGANFLLKAVHHEAFTYWNGQEEFIQIDQDDLFPFLLVNIGSGVSMIKVNGEREYERVSGTSVGGGTFWGLGRLLTKCKSFDELLELSHRGNNRVVDMLVGDIYGGTDYSKIGLASTTIASSFGKAVGDNKELEDYKPEDLARSLLRMISNNIGQIAYLNALRFGLKKIFFGGFFIRGHSFTMDTISVAVNYWSKGEAKAMFLRHEGFLGALGAFKRYEKNPVNDLIVGKSLEVPTSASYSAEEISNPRRKDAKGIRSIQCTINAS